MNGSESKSEAAAGPTNTETLMGGAEVVVEVRGGGGGADTLKGGHRTGVVTETVRVRQLPIKLFPAMRSALRDEIGLVALYCDKPRAWVEELELSSHELLVKEGKRINWDFFCRWVGRQEETEGYMPKMDPAETAAIVAAVAKANPGLLERVIQDASNGGGAAGAGTGGSGGLISGSGLPRQRTPADLRAERR